MSDDALVDVPEEAPVVHPAVADALAAIKADSEAEAVAAAAAQVAHDERCAKIDAVKAKVNAVTGPVNDALLAATDPRERAALEQLMRDTVAPFEAELAAAYSEFTGVPAGSAPSAPAGVTQIDSVGSAGVAVHPTS